MPDNDETFDPGSYEADHSGFVPACFARNMDEAEDYCGLLSDHDIPARAGVDEDLLDERDPEHEVASKRGMTHGVPVLVPETLLDEASEVIADRDDFVDFDDDEEDDDEEEGFGMDELTEDSEAFLEDDGDDDTLFGGGDDLDDETDYEYS